MYSRGAEHGAWCPVSGVYYWAVCEQNWEVCRKTKGFLLHTTRKSSICLLMKIYVTVGTNTARKTAAALSKKMMGSSRLTRATNLAFSNAEKKKT